MNITCIFCEDVVQVIDDEMKIANVSTVAIATAVKVMCGIFASRIGKRECDFIVGKIKDIVNALTQGVDKATICRDLHMCTNL